MAVKNDRRLAKALANQAASHNWKVLCQKGERLKFSWFSSKQNTPKLYKWGQCSSLSQPSLHPSYCRRMATIQMNNTTEGFTHRLL